jgi:hypothetical protein
LDFKALEQSINGELQEFRSFREAKHRIFNVPVWIIHLKKEKYKQSMEKANLYARWKSKDFAIGYPPTNPFGNKNFIYYRYLFKLVGGRLSYSLADNKFFDKKLIYDLKRTHHYKLLINNQQNDIIRMYSVCVFF